MSAGIFLTVKDLMTLTGCNNERSAAKSHQVIRECIAVGKRKLTIKEYCDYEKINLKEVWDILRKEQNFPF